MKSRTRSAVLAAILFFSVPLFFQSPLGAQAPQGKKLVVGVSEDAPFAYKDSVGEWVGLSVDLWKLIARKANFEYEFKELRPAELMTGLRQDRIDVAMGDFTVTMETEKAVNFSQVYFSSDLGIGFLKKKEHQPAALLIRMIFSEHSVRVILIVLGLLLTMGGVIYLIERKHDPDTFGGHWIKGLFCGVYWSGAMMSGCGDQTPRSLHGRFISLLWIFASIFLMSSFTAAITDALTAERLSPKLERQEDLPHFRLAVLENTCEGFLRKAGARVSVYPTEKAVLDAVVRKEADACVLSEAELKFMANQSYRDQLSILPMAHRREFYAYGLPPKSSIREALNLALLEILEGPEWDEIRGRYL